MDSITFLRSHNINPSIENGGKKSTSCQDHALDVNEINYFLKILRKRSSKNNNILQSCIRKINKKYC